MRRWERSAGLGPLLDGWMFVAMHTLLEPTQSEIRGFERHGVARSATYELVERAGSGQTDLWRLLAERRRNNRPLAWLAFCLMPSLAPLIPRLGAGGLGSTNLRPGS